MNCKSSHRQKDADHEEREDKRMTTPRVSLTIKLFNVKLPLRRIFSNSRYHSSGFISQKLTLVTRSRTIIVNDRNQTKLKSQTIVTRDPVLIKKRSHSTSNNFHIKKQFHSFNFFDYSFLFRYSKEADFCVSVCARSKQRMFSLKRRSRKRKLNWFCVGDFIICFVIILFGGEAEPW